MKQSQHSSQTNAQYCPSKRKQKVTEHIMDFESPHPTPRLFCFPHRKVLTECFSLYFINTVHIHPLSMQQFLQGRGGKKKVRLELQVLAGRGVKQVRGSVMSAAGLHDRLGQNCFCTVLPTSLLNERRVLGGSS